MSLITAVFCYTKDYMWGPSLGTTVNWLSKIIQFNAGFTILYVLENYILKSVIIIKCSIFSIYYNAIFFNVCNLRIVICIKNNYTI